MITGDDFQSIGTFVPNDELAGALTLIETPNGLILLQLRDMKEGIHWPGKWGIFGGGIEPGEDIMTAALREVEEEMGLVLTPAQLTPLAKINSLSRNRAALYVFHCVLDITPADIKLGEGAGFAFLTEEQIAKIDILDTLRPVLDLFFAGRQK